MQQSDDVYATHEVPAVNFTAVAATHGGHPEAVKDAASAARGAEASS